MRGNSKKIAAAERATDVVVGAFHEANSELNVCMVNGAGVLDDPRLTQSRLHKAKIAIEKGLQAISRCDWPTHEDYGD